MTEMARLRMTEAARAQNDRVATGGGKTGVRVA